jgi:hypothetical protein
LISPVNPETEVPIAIGAILWLDDDGNRAGLLLIKPGCSVEEECTDEVIDRSTDFV